MLDLIDPFFFLLETQTQFHLFDNGFNCLTINHGLSFWLWIMVYLCHMCAGRVCAQGASPIGLIPWGHPPRKKHGLSYFILIFSRKVFPFLFHCSGIFGHQEQTEELSEFYVTAKWRLCPIFIPWRDCRLGKLQAFSSLNSIMWSWEFGEKLIIFIFVQIPKPISLELGLWNANIDPSD